MQWLAMIICLYAGVASARTEEDHQASSVSGSSFPEQCFYRQPTDCPDLDTDPNKCPCKRITIPNAPESNAALCCNIDKNGLEHGLTCISKYCCCKGFIFCFFKQHR